MQEHKKWVIGSFAVLAIAMSALLVRFALRAGMQAGGMPSNTQAMQELASQKEIAAALKDPARREEAVRALREQKDVAAVDMLAALGHKNKDPEVRAAALTALGDIVEADDMRGVQVLTLGVRDEAPVVRMAAVRAMGQVATDTAYAAVADALKDMQIDVRRVAAEVLSVGEGSSATVAKLTAAFPEDQDVEMRRLMALALGRVKDEPARRCLLAALGRQGETEPSVRLAAVESLGAWKDEYGTEGLAVGMCDSDDAVRARARAFFVELGVSALTNLTAALQSGKVRGALHGVRGRAALDDMLDVLPTLKTPLIADPLIPILDIAVGAAESPAHPSIRDRAVAQLADIGEPAVGPLVAAVLKADTRFAMKAAGAQAFAGVGVAAVAPIRAYIESRKVLPSSEEARLWVATFERIGGGGAAEAITVAKSRDPEQVFRQYAAALPPVSTNRPPAPQLQEFSLVLHGGVYPGNPPNAYARRKDSLPFVKSRSVGDTEIAEYRPTHTCPVALDLVRLTNGWGRIMGHPSVFNQIVFGKIDRLTITDEAMEGELRLNMYRDPWLLGGYGEYAIALKRLDDGSYRGTFKGRYRDVPIEGIATCVEKPKRAPLRAGFRPVGPNEHPRMLFRTDDLPRLRSRLNTPFGRAAFRRMATSPNHVALGVLYQLTGDPAYATQAIPMVEREMADRDFGFMGLGQVWGGRFSNVALAYDLCYDAWPVEFRAKVNRYLVSGSYATATNMGKFSSCANTHPCSNYYSPIVGGGSMLALAYWMDPGSAPMPPWGARLLEPAMLRQRPSAGASVALLRSNEPLGQWLWSGPIYARVSADELVETSGGDSNDVLQEGRVLKIAGGEYPFHPPPPDVLQGGDIYPWLKTKEEKPGCACVGMALYTVLQNVRAGYYKVALPRQGSTHCSLGGVVLPHGAYLHLEAGLYPLLIGFTGDDSMVVPVGVRFRFVTDRRKEVDILIAADAAKAKGEQVAYELDLADHTTTGMDGWKINVLNRTLQQMVRSHRLLMGSGGFQSEGEGYHHTADTPIRYATACWNMFGQTLSPYPDVTDAVARYVAQCTLYPNPRAGTARIYAQSFNGGHDAGFTLPGFIALGFPCAPDEYKPAMLWVWNRLCGVDAADPESYVKLLGQGVGQAVHTFVNYPLDPATGKSAIEPRHPNESFPKTWQAVDKGLYVFRNRWRDAGDIVLQVYANQLMSKGHGQPDAGGIRVHGLGYDWTLTSPGKGGAFRWLQNVVVLPPDVGMNRAPGVVTSWQAETNGSGRVSIDMSLVYKGARGHDPVGTWPPDPIPPGEVRGRRAVAADYSGKCGAPALFAFVDRIEGGPERFWLWNPPGYGSVKAKDLRVETAANTFTMHQDKASLRAVFVTPDDTVVQSPGTIHVRDLKSKEAQAKRKKDRNYTPDPTPQAVPIAAKAKPEESFFVVMTLQEGPAPEVRIVSGAGLEAVIQVGGRQIRFDGENVLIGDAP